MNDKIPLRRFAATFADAAGIEPTVAEEFIKSLFGIIAEELQQGHSVTVNGLGTFNISQSEHEPVMFTPDTSFRDTVNTPFEIFSPVTLAQQVTEEMLNSVNNVELADNEANEIIDDSADDEIATPTPQPEEEAQPEPSLEPTPKPTPEPEPKLEPKPEVKVSEEYAEELQEEHPRSNSFRNGFIAGLVIGIAIGLLALCAYVFYYVNSPSPTIMDELTDTEVTDTTTIIP